MRKDIIYLVAGIVCILVSVCVSIVYSNILLSCDVSGLEVFVWFTLLNSSQLALFSFGRGMIKHAVTIIRERLVIKKYLEGVKEYEKKRKEFIESEPFAEFL